METTEVAPYKFGRLVENEDVPYHYPNIWRTEPTKGPDRLIIAPGDGQIDLILALTDVLPEPFAILYILHMPRSDAAPARYQGSPVPREIMREFLQQFRDLFEQDGRHHLWVVSLLEDYSLYATLVYDYHNVIYAYGPLSDFRTVVDHRGLTEAADVPFPLPHTHHYNEQFDAEAERLLTFWEWRQTPLHSGDDE